MIRTFSLFLTLLLILPTQAKAFCLLGDCCIEGNCINGVGTYESSEGTIYIGNWENGKKSGKGEEKKVSELYYYKGEFHDNMRNGNGIAYYGNKNNKYEGLWKNNKRHGIGTMTWIDGNGSVDSYKGEWKNDEKSGKGSQRYENGMIYTGSWKNGLQHGGGILYFTDGTNYEGIWENGKLLPKYENLRKASETSDLKDEKSLAEEEKHIPLPAYALKKPNYYKKSCPGDIHKLVECNKSGKIYSCISDGELGEGLNIREALIQACF